MPDEGLACKLKEGGPPLFETPAPAEAVDLQSEQRELFKFSISAKRPKTGSLEKPSVDPCEGTKEAHQAAETVHFVKVRLLLNLETSSTIGVSFATLLLCAYLLLRLEVFRSLSTKKIPRRWVEGLGRIGSSEVAEG